MIDALRGHLELSGGDAIAVTIAVVVLYAVFSLSLAVFGQRLRARLSVFSVAFLTIIGSVTARAMLGPTPTMAAGLLILAELLALQALFNAVRHHGPRLGLRSPSAKAVMVNGVVNETLLAATRMRSDELWARLRRAGVRHRNEVAYAVVESDGTLTVIKAGAPVEPALLAGIVGLPSLGEG